MTNRKRQNFVIRILKIAKQKPYLLELVAIFLLVGICFLIYLPFLNAAPTTIFGDEPRYHTYQTMFIQYSWQHFRQFGFWDPFISSGTSWLSHPGGPHFSPFTWVAVLLFSSQYSATKFLIISHIVTAAVCFYFLCRVLRLNRFVAFAVTVPFIANRYALTMGINGWLEDFYGLYLLPLTTGLLWLSLTTRRYRYSILGGMALALHFFENTYYVFHYNIIVLIVVTFGFYVKNLFGKSFRKDYKQLITASTLFWLTFIGIAAVKVLPLLEFRHISARFATPIKDIETPDAVMSFSFYFERIQNMIAEKFSGNAANTNWLTQLGNNVGFGALIITLIYGLVRKSFKYIVAIAVLVIGSWGFFANTMPFDLYAFFYKYLPGFNSNIFPFRFIIIIHFAYFVCVALGLHVLITNRRLYTLRFVAIIAGIVLVLSAATYNYNRYHVLVPTLPAGVDFTTELNKEQNVLISKPEDVKSQPIISGNQPTNLLVLLSKIMQSYQTEGRVYSTVVGSPSSISTIEALTTQIPVVQHSYEPIVPTYEFSNVKRASASDDLSMVKKRYKIFSILNARFQLQGDKQFEFPGCQKLGLLETVDYKDNVSDDVCQFLEGRLTIVANRKNEGLYFDKDVLPKVSLIPQSIFVISDNRFTDYNAFISKQILFHPDLREPMTTVLSDTNKPLNAYDLDELKVFSVIALVDPKISDQSKAQLLLNQYINQGGKVITLHSQWLDYPNLQHRSGSIYTDKPAWSYTSDDEINLRNILSLTSSDQDQAGKVLVDKYSPERWEIQATTVKPNTVVQLSDSYYPGWQAKLDGKSTKLYMADGLVKAIVIKEPGTHSVVFYYSPSSFKKGALLSMATLLLICLYIFRRKLPLHRLSFTQVMNNGIFGSARKKGRRLSPSKA